MMKALEKNESCCESIQQRVHARKKMMEADVARLCDTNYKTCAMKKDALAHARQLFTQT
jgi:hypothetical protein